jgi:hypothetical protein
MATAIYANNAFQILVAATDPDNFPGAGLTYFWTQVAGPAQASFSNIYALQPNVTCPVAGNYTFQVTVSDGITPTSAQISVTVLPFYTSTKSYTAVCPSGSTGSTVVQQAVYTSIVSQAEADSLALAAATTAATAGLVCVSTPAVYTLTIAQSILPSESLTYNLYLLTGGNATNPSQAQLLQSYPLDGVHYSAGNTIDWSSVATQFSGEQIFLWQCRYQRLIAGSGVGSVSFTRDFPLAYTVLSLDPSYTNIGKCYDRGCPASGDSHLTAVLPTNEIALRDNSTYIDAPNVVQTYLAMQDNFVSPPISRLWIYNWDQQVAATNATTYDYLKISILSSGTLSAPITETTIYEENNSVATYGANMADADENYISLDPAVAALGSLGGVIIVRRGNYDPVGQEIVYGPDSVVLNATYLAGSGIATVGSLSGNANIPENINGAVTVSNNTLQTTLRILAGAFGIRTYNWRAQANVNYDTLVVYQLIGSPGSFTGTAAQYAFSMNPPNSPCGWNEIPLPTNANGVSFAVYAATSTGTNTYNLWPDSFPLGTTVGTNFEDIFNISTTAPYTVTSLPAGAIAGLPSAANSVFTVIDSTRQVILERAASYG